MIETMQNQASEIQLLVDSIQGTTTENAGKSITRMAIEVIALLRSYCDSYIVELLQLYDEDIVNSPNADLIK